MFLLDPPPSQLDLHFKLLGIPVRVHPFFWLVSVFMGLKLEEPRLILLWVAAVFVSILVHEFGHALSARACGWPPRVVLYGMGGFAAFTPDHRAPWRRIGVTFAGPGAGFLLAGLIILILFATNHSAPGFAGFWFGWGAPIANRNLLALIYFLLEINIAWGLINLLPVYPLDGGQIARELWGMREAEVPAMRKTLVLTMATGIIVAVVALVYRGGKSLDGDLFMPILFGLLAFNAYRMLQQLNNVGGYGGGWGGGSDYDDDRRWR